MILVNESELMTEVNLEEVEERVKVLLLLLIKYLALEAVNKNINLNISMINFTKEKVNQIFAV